MSRYLILIAWVLGTLPVLTPARAQMQEPAFEPFDGHITADDVNVRAGPGKLYYIITQLDKNAPVHVHDNVYGWYKISPPKGTWSLISKTYVELNPDGKTGKVTGDRVLVRAPNPAGTDDSYHVQLKLDTGDVVQLIGSDIGYYRIVPPDGAYVFVSEQYIKKGKAAAPPPEPPVPPSPQPPTVDRGEQPAEPTDPAVPAEPTAPAEPAEPAQPQAIKVTLLERGDVLLGDRTLTPAQLTQALKPIVQADGNTLLIIQASQNLDYQKVMKVVEAARLGGITKARVVKQAAPVGSEPPVVVAEPAEPAESAEPPEAEQAQKELTALEQQYTRASARPLEEQPLDELIGQYGGLLNDPRLGRDGQALINTRLEILRTRRQLLAARRELSERKEREQVRVQQQPTPQYNAVGKLHASSLYTGGRLPLLYRLVDPLNGLIVAYVRPAEGLNLAGLSGRYVGIVGESTYDEAMRLRIITPQRIDALGQVPAVEPQPARPPTPVEADADGDAAEDPSPPSMPSPAPRWEDR